MSGGAWSQNPIWTSTALTAAITSPNLNAYRELMVVIKGLVHATAIEFTLQFGVGGVPDATPANYVCAGASSPAVVGGFFFCQGAAAVTPVSAIIEITNFNLPTQSWLKTRGGRENSVTGVRNSSGYNIQANAWENISITTNALSAFGSNGGINVYARQP
jgi:hypothetical protein